MFVVSGIENGYKILLERDKERATHPLILITEEETKIYKMRWPILINYYLRFIDWQRQDNKETFQQFMVSSPIIQHLQSIQREEAFYLVIYWYYRCCLLSIVHI